MDVLVIDDDPGVLTFLRRALEQAGYMVRTAENGLEAIANLQTQTYQAIICDVGLPVLEGRRFFDELKVANPEQAQRLIFLTGSVDDPSVRKYLEQSGRPFLGKPVPLATLLAVVRGTVTNQGP
jgi:CheY-like chemotaxis protein